MKVAWGLPISTPSKCEYFLPFLTHCYPPRWEFLSQFNRTQWFYILRAYVWISGATQYRNILQSRYKLVHPSNVFHWTVQFIHLFRHNRKFANIDFLWRITCWFLKKVSLYNKRSVMGLRRNISRSLHITLFRHTGRHDAHSSGFPLLL